MGKILYIKGNPKAESGSYSLSVGREFLNSYKLNHPRDEVIEIDVYKDALPLVDEDILNAWDKLQMGKSYDALSNIEKEKVQSMNQIVDQFIDADKYIFITPMWNFSIPPLLKAYLDSLVIAGKTFEFSEKGIRGLLMNKKALIIMASGGVYSVGPMEEYDFCGRYIKILLGFLGVTDTQCIYVEGVSQTPAEAANIKARCIQKAKELAAKF